MKKLLSLILSVILIVTMFASTAVLQVGATGAEFQITDEFEDGFRYRSVFDFSQDIPATTTKNKDKVYTVERAQDVENGNKWAMKITQKDSQWTNDYIRFRLTDQITVPTGEGLPFNEKLVGIRMKYRSVNSMSGNIGLFNDGDWIGRISKYDSSNYRAAGSFIDTLMFANSEKKVELGGKYYLEFELHAPNANSEVEIYIYDIQFVYEVTEYRYSAVYDFDNMTTAQAQSIFVYHEASSYAHSDVSIIEDNGEKAVQIKANEIYVHNGEYCTTDYRIDNFYIPNDEHCVGIRIQYEGINLRDGQIKFVQNYGKWAWTNTNFLTSSSTDIGKEDVAVFFADDTTLTKGEKHQLRFQLRGAKGDLDVLPGIKIYKIEFLYDDVFDGVVTDLIKEPIVAPANGGNKDYKIPVATLQDSNVIGMRIRANFAASGAHRIQMVYNGQWTTLVFNPYGSQYVLSQGIHDLVVMFQDDSTEINGLVKNGEYNSGADFRDRSKWTYDPVIRTQPGSNTITLEEIQLIYKKDESSGDEGQEQPNDSPEYRYSTVYDFENMSDAQAQALFVRDRDNYSNITVVNDETRNDKAVQILAYENTVKDGYYYTDYKIENFAIPNDKHCVGIRMQYQGIDLYDARIEFVQGGAWTKADLGKLAGDANQFNDVNLLFKDYPNLTTGNSTLRFQIRSEASKGLLPGIKIYKIEFVYDDVFDGDAEDLIKEPIEVTTYPYNYEIPLNKLKNSGVIGMRIKANLAANGAPRIQMVYNDNWTTLVFNEHTNTLYKGIHDLVVMFQDDSEAINGLVANGEYNSAYDLRDINTWTKDPVIRVRDTSVKVTLEEIQLIYAKPTTAKFVDVSGISGTKNVYETEGRIGDTIEFPENTLASKNKYEYLFAGWAATGKDDIVENPVHDGTNVKYYAVWKSGISRVRKVLLGSITTDSLWVENDIDDSGTIDVRDLLHQAKYVRELEFQDALVEMNMPGTSFLKSFGEQEEASMNGFDGVVNEAISTSKTLATNDYIQVNFDEYTSVNTFTVNETTANVRDFTIKAWNGEEWVRVYRNDLIEGTHECVLEQDVCTLAIRLYIDELVDGASSATIASVTANYQGQIERNEKFGLTAFIGDQSYWQDWDKIDSDVLMSYDDIILINNWHFDEDGNLGISAAVGDNKAAGSIRSCYRWDSQDGKNLTKTFLDKYNALYDNDVKEEDKPNLWLSLTALTAGEGSTTTWDDTTVKNNGNNSDNFDPMNKEWWETYIDLFGKYQAGESDAYGNQSVRTALVNNIINYINYIETELGYEIYGIDIDWEYPSGDDQQEDYNNLLKELGTALHAKSKKLSIDQLVDYAVLPYQYYNNEYIDRINVMTYSMETTGTDKQHSTYLDACVKVINMYEKENVDLSKIYLGVPFYGVGTVQTNSSTDWNKVGRSNASAFDRGVNVYTYNDVEYSFNGPNVLQDKALYSLRKKLGGMMVWWIKNDYTEIIANKDSVDYNEDLTLTYHLREAVDKFSKVTTEQ